MGIDVLSTAHWWEQGQFVVRFESSVEAVAVHEGVVRVSKDADMVVEFAVLVEYFLSEFRMFFEKSVEGSAEGVAGLDIDCDLSFTSGFGQIGEELPVHIPAIHARYKRVAVYSMNRPTQLNNKMMY